ncbi:MAG: SPASM domain-containing protein [Bacteriovoracaceae bacterium]
MNSNDSSERYIDPSTHLKKKLVSSALKYHNGMPIFSLIEFNIYGNCNRSCSFCPVSMPEIYTRKMEGIDVSLFEKAMNDLREIDYQGTILFSAFSEPTLHKELPGIIRLAKRIVPQARVEMVSNGDTIRKNKQKLMGYYEAGIDRINFSLYDGPKQMEEFLNIRKELGLNEDQMNLRRRYFEDGNFGMTISNRAGLINSNEYRDEKEEEIVELPLKASCYYPSYMLLVDYSGEVILCPHDWEKKFTAGNIKDKTIWDIWAGDRFKLARKLLAEKNRKFAPCNKCDVKGDVMGKESFEAWNECYKS